MTPNARSDDDLTTAAADVDVRLASKMYESLPNSPRAVFSNIGWGAE